MSKFIKRKFTLIELLVVVGIIGLLITMLMPALGKATMKANRVVNKSNMTSIVKSILTATTDSKSKFADEFKRVIVIPGGEDSQYFATTLSTNIISGNGIATAGRYGVYDNAIGSKSADVAKYQGLIDMVGRHPFEGDYVFNPFKGSKPTGSPAKTKYDSRSRVLGESIEDGDSPDQILSVAFADAHIKDFQYGVIWYSTDNIAQSALNYTSGFGFLAVEGENQ